MNNAAFNALKKMKDSPRHKELVFVHRDGRVPNFTKFTERIFKPAANKAGLPVIRLHDIRTSYSANFVMAGGNIYTLSKILGHSSVEITASRYAHLDPNYLKSESELVNFSGELQEECPKSAPRNFHVV